MKPRPLNLSAGDAQGSDVFFEELLRSCATPTRNSSDYQSTPEPVGYHGAPKLHRKRGKVASPNLSGEGSLVSRPKQRTAAPQDWPKRTSSIQGSMPYASEHRPSSLRTSFESSEESAIEDGYDHHSEARHNVLCSLGFWPRVGTGIGPAQKGTGEDDRHSEVKYSLVERYNGPSEQEHHRSDAPRVEATQNKFDLRRSILFEPDSSSIISYPSIHTRPLSLNFDDAASLLPTTVFTPGNNSDSAYDSEPEISFESTTLFQPRNRYPSDTVHTLPSAWPHTYGSIEEAKICPPFEDGKLEEYRLADPGLLLNVDKPMPSNPYRSLGRKTLSREEFLMALGYHAMTQCMELPLIYAAKPNIGKRWVDEDGVREGAQKFNERLEDVCKVKLEAIERIRRQDDGLMTGFGLDGH